MDKLRHQRQVLSDVERLILTMENEITLLRNIVYRYYLMHGNQLQEGSVCPPEDVSFYISSNEKGVKCEVIKHKGLGVESEYQKIKKEISGLS